jgi:hypothetical protein
MPPVEDTLDSAPADRGAARVPGLAVLAGFGLALLSVLLAGISGGPYLTAADVNGWIVLFAAALFAALFALPFLIERLTRDRIEDSERRWERALVAWGAIALGALLVFVLVGLGGDFSGHSLAGSVGLVGGVEAVLVLGTMLVWILSG